MGKVLEVSVEVTPAAITAEAVLAEWEKIMAERSLPASLVPRARAYAEAGARAANDLLAEMSVVEGCD
jgi:hypothetical protein